MLRKIGGKKYKNGTKGSIILLRRFIKQERRDEEGTTEIKYFNDGINNYLYCIM